MLRTATGDAITLLHSPGAALTPPPVGTLGGAGGGAAVWIPLELFAAGGTLAPEGLLLTVRVTRPLHNAAVRISPVLLTPGGALAPLCRLHALGGTLLGAASRVPFEPLALSWALVVGGLVHALPGAPLGGQVAHGHKGGGSKSLAAGVGHLVLETLFALFRTGLEAFRNILVSFTLIISLPVFEALFTLLRTRDKAFGNGGVFFTSFISFTVLETLFTNLGTFSEAFWKVGVLFTVVISFTLGIGSLALARAAFEEALLVPGEGAAVEGPVPVGDLLPGLLLAELWARGAAFFPR